MQPVELRIPGSYYDSQIYSGNLYLWSMDGAIITIDWNDLISRIDVNRSLNPALHCALQRSEYLYSDQFGLFFGDPDIRNLLLSKFDLLAQAPIDISQELLESCIFEKQDNPFSFPHSDSGNGNLFVGGQEGVQFSDTHERSIEPDRLTDLPTLGIALGSGRLAVAAGGEGVHQLDIFPSPTGVFRARCIQICQLRPVDADCSVCIFNGIRRRIRRFQNDSSKEKR